MTNTKYHIESLKDGTILFFRDKKDSREKALEFDTEKDAKVFLGSMTLFSKKFSEILKAVDIKEHSVNTYANTEILNATGKIIVLDRKANRFILEEVDIK